MSRYKRELRKKAERCHNGYALLRMLRLNERYLRNQEDETWDWAKGFNAGFKNAVRRINTDLYIELELLNRAGELGVR